MTPNERANYAKDCILKHIPLYPKYISAMNLQITLETFHQYLIPSKNYFHGRLKALLASQRVIRVGRGRYARPTDRSQIERHKEWRRPKPLTPKEKARQQSELLTRRIADSRRALGLPTDAPTWPEQRRASEIARQTADLFETNTPTK